MARLDGFLKLRVPRRLIEALDAEADRRLLTRAAAARVILGQALGLDKGKSEQRMDAQSDKGGK